MKHICKEELVNIPEGVTVNVKARRVTVKGPRGTLTRDLKHIQMDIQRTKKTQLRVIVWQGGRKHIACIRTVTSHIKNMITGVTKGFEYKVVYAAAHFPMSAAIVKDGDKHAVEIRNFLGERFVRKIPMLPGVEVKKTDNEKDGLIISGNDVLAVSQSAANIHQSALVRNKDIRKFLDGIYVQSKSTIVKDEE